MTGRVVHTPDLGHHCRPGCTYHTITEADVDPTKPFSLPRELLGSRSISPPSAYDYPAGTVWECDECGTRWTALAPPSGAPGHCDFRRESRWARRRREKRETRR